MTNAELKAAIKNALKENGIAKGYTISAQCAGYSTAVRITITNPHVNGAEVERIARAFDEYERDASGEILDGGNTFVIVEAKDGIYDEIAAAYMPQAVELMNSEGEITMVAEDVFFISCERAGEYELRVQRPNVWGKRRVYTPEQLSVLLYKLDAFGTIAA